MRGLFLSIFLTSCANGCTGASTSQPAPLTAADDAVAPDKAGPIGSLPKNQRSSMGMNLRFVSYSTTDWPFLDLVKMGSPWISRTSEKWDDGRRLERDDAGWVKSLEPGQWAASLVPTVIGGKLVLLYRGKGTLSVDNAKILEQREGRILFEAKPRDQIVVNLTSTDARDPVRDLVVVPPQFEKNHEEQLFHPLFLERLAPFSVIRFLEWMHTNGSQVAGWEDRSLPSYAYQSTDVGVAYEYMIALSNRLDADIWIPIPHLATDDHVQKLAELLKKELKPELRVYVEWSNEVWNDSPAFTQAEYSKTQGMAAKLDREDSNAARLRFQSQRSVQVFSIFERVFSGEKRLIRVIGSQSGNTWAHEQLLQHQKAYEHVDALAIAPYFGNEIGSPDREDWLVRSSTEEVLDHLEQQSLPEVLGWIRDSAKLAKKYHLHLIAYEGGQHLVANPSIHNNPAVNDRMDAVNRHERMRKLTLSLLQGWREAGGRTFVYYAFAGPPGKWGRFGALEHIDQPIDSANKYGALIQFVEANPRWW